MIGNFAHPGDGVGIALGNEHHFIAPARAQMVDQMQELAGKILVNEQIFHSKYSRLMGGDAQRPRLRAGMADGAACFATGLDAVLPEGFAGSLPGGLAEILATGFAATRAAILGAGLGAGLAGATRCAGLVFCLAGAVAAGRGRKIT